jgi:hypothetical protein
MAIAGAVWWSNSQPITPLSAVPAPATPAPSGLPPTTVADAVVETPIPEESSPASPDPSPDPAPSALEEIIGRSLPGVAGVQTPSSRGSGFFVRPDTVITNAHVVGNDAFVTVRRANNTSTSARVEVRSPAFDLAVLRVVDIVPDQPTIPLGTNAKVRIGHEVVAIGTPLGFLQNSVSRGIVSGLRHVGESTLVQTDAAVNPGNSGGPLLNRDGEVIGVIKAGYLGNEGLSFAVAVDHVRAVLNGRTEDRPARSTASPVDEWLPPTIPPANDEHRLNAARDFERAISELARRADAFDRSWKSFVDQCYRGQIVGNFDRQWFALWETRAMQGIVAQGCAPYFNDFRRQADELRRAVVAADEAARRGDVYPGIRRDVLRKFRLDYWTR